MTDESAREADGADDGTSEAASDGTSEPASDDAPADADDESGAGTGSVGTGSEATDPSSTDAGGDDGPLAADPVLDPESIDPSALTVEQRALHPRIRIVWIARAVLLAVVGGLIAGGVAWALDRDPVAPAAAVGIALLVLGVAFAVLRYRAWRYEVREDALYLERGVLTRVRTVVPTVRLQHVDTRRGPVDRVAGLATVVVYTAGSRGADVSIPGVTADDADDLQQRLKRLAIASEADTSV